MQSCALSHFGDWHLRDSLNQQPNKEYLCTFACFAPHCTYRPRCFLECSRVDYRSNALRRSGPWDRLSRVGCDRRTIGYLGCDIAEEEDSFTEPDVVVATQAIGTVLPVHDPQLSLIRSIASASRIELLGANARAILRCHPYRSRMAEPSASRAITARSLLATSAARSRS